MLKSLSIIGAGRVGRALGRRFRELGWKIGVVSCSTEAHARKAVRFIGAGKPKAGVTALALDSLTILICVPDDAIVSAADELAYLGGASLRGKVVLHASGALDAAVLASLRACGASTGSMHPLQTFSGLATPPLEGKVFGIEGDAAAVRHARAMVRALGGVPVILSAQKKPLYHAAGAFAAGHLLAMEEAGAQMLIAAGLNRSEAHRALLSLSRQVLEHYEMLGPHKAWTGPLARGDYGVVASHTEALREFQPEFREAYEAVSRLAVRVLAKDPEPALSQLATISEQERPANRSKGDTE